MSFALPIGLAALFTLPIILILHLIREQRRRQKVPSLLHWQNIPQRFDGKNRRLLPLTLLLLMHLIIAALIGVALGRPQLPGTPSEGARHIAIVIDTSTSMATRQGLGTRFSEARDRARGLLRGLRPGDRASLIAAGPRATLIASGGAGDVALLSAALDRLRPGGSADMTGALALAEAALDAQYKRQIVIVTDGALPPLPPQDLLVPVEWQRVGSDAPNRAIIAFAARPWGGKIQIYARVANYSDAPFPTTLRLYDGNRTLNTDAVALAPRGETELTWTLPAQPMALRAELDGRDALPDDDQAFLSIAPARPITVLLVSNEPAELQRALQAVPGVRLTTIETREYLPGHTADLTVFDSFLPEAWPDGAVLVINPVRDSALLPIGEQPVQIAADSVRQHDELLEGLSFSGVTFGLVQRLDPQPAWATAQLAALSADDLQTGQIGGVETPLVLRGRSGEHEIAIWTFDVTGSNLPARLAFPLLVARTVRDLTPAALPAGLTAGGELSLRPDTRATAIRITAPDGSTRTLDIFAAQALDRPAQPGFYQIEERSDDALLFSGQVGVSAGNAIESNIAPQPEPLITGTADDPGGAPQTNSLDLWPWFAMGALAVLSLEWLYVLR